MISRSPRWSAGEADGTPTRRRSSIEGRRLATAPRRRRRQVGASTRTAPSRANGSRRVPSSSATRSGKPSTRPQDCHSARMSSLVLEENSGSDSAGSPCSSTTAMAVGGLVDRAGEADGNTAECCDRQIQRHAHAADATAYNDALTMQIDDAPALIGRFICGFKTHGQREGVEPQRAARPGSEPAGFHLTPRKTRLPPGCCRPVAATMPARSRNRLKNPG